MKKPRSKNPLLSDIGQAPGTTNYVERINQEINKSFKSVNDSISKINVISAGYPKDVMEALDSQIKQTIAKVPWVDIRGLNGLCDAIETALLKPEVKKSTIAVGIGKKFIELIQENSIPESPDSAFDPITTKAIETHTTEVHRRAGSASKKQSGKGKALTSWKGWVAKPETHKNKAAWIRHITGGEQKYCNSNTTANAWFKEFRSQVTSDKLEKRLPINNH